MIAHTHHFVIITAATIATIATAVIAITAVAATGVFIGCAGGLCLVLGLCLLGRCIGLGGLVAAPATATAAARFAAIAGGVCGGFACVGCIGCRLGPGQFDARNFCLNQGLDRGKVLFVARRADHKGRALAPGPTGAANAMHVIFGMAGHVEIKHMADIRNIKPTRRHIRGAQEPQAAIAELIERFHPLALIKIAMDGGGIIAIFFQRFCTNIDIGFAIAKDDGVFAGLALAFDQRAQQGALFAGFAVAAAGFEHYHALGDVFRCGGLARHFDAFWRRQECVGDAFDLGRHGGREKQRLAGKGRKVKYALDIGDKAHIQHAVGLVYHHDLHAGQQQLAALEMVQQAAGRGDQHVNAAVDQLVLFLETDAADQQRFGQFQVFCVGVKIFGHLRCQFAGGAQHQAARHARAGAALGQHGDHRQCKAGGFACAGLGDTQNIAPQ